MSYVDNMVERISDSLKEELKAALLREEDRRSWYERDEYVQKLKNAIGKADRMMRETVRTYMRIHNDPKCEVDNEFYYRAQGLVEANFILRKIIDECDPRVMPDVGD